MTCCCHGDRDKTEDCEHLCTGACSCDKIRVGEKFQCPYVQTCCLGKIIAIPTFEMISETMVTRAGAQCWDPGKRPRSSVAERARSSDGGCDQYLLFDMRDVIYIGNCVEADKTDERGVDNQRETTSIDDGHEILKNDTRDVIYVGNNIDVIKTDGRGVDKQRQITKTEVVKRNVNNNVQTAKDQVSNAHCNQPPFEMKQKLSTLHKHSRPGGGIFYCRKIECSEKAVIENDEIRVGSQVNIKSELSVAVQEACVTESEEHRLDLEVNKSTRQPLKLSKSAFTGNMEPVTRKRGIVNTETDVTKANERDQADCNKIPRIDCTDKKPFEELVTKTIENENVVKHSVKSGTTVGRSTNNEANVTDKHTLELKPAGGCKDVIIYMESKGSLMSADRLLRFNADCLVLKSQGNEKVL